MFRWRCYRRACGRATYGKKAHRRKSTKRKLAPKCPGCGHDMRLDLRRTTGAEKRKHNCHCGGPQFAPHQRNYCQRLKVREYEVSNAGPRLPDPEVPF
jgi:hypothetical protein